MSLELIRESLHLNQLIGDEATQTVVDNDIIVPDSKPDIARIILLDGDVFVNRTEVIQDKVLIDGVICFKILYTSDEADDEVKSINTNATFSHGLDIDNAESGMTCKVKCDLEHLDYSILNGRKINIKAIVKINGKVIDRLEQSLIVDIDADEGVEVLKENVRINCFAGEGVSNCLISETMEVPPGNPAIKELLRNDIKICNKDYKIADNKIVAKGDLIISTLYISEEDRKIQHMEHEIPFTEFIDMHGISEDAYCDLEFQIIDSRFEAEEDSDGEIRAMSTEVELAIVASGYEKRSIEVVEDAYSRNVKIDMEKEAIKTEEKTYENKSQVVLKDTISVQDENPSIAEVFNVKCKPIVLDTKIQDEKVIIEGLVHNKVLYMSNSDDQQVYCIDQEVSFEHCLESIGIMPDMVCEIEIDVDHCNYSMVSSNEVEIRLVLTLNLKAYSKVSIPVVVKVSELPQDIYNPENQPSIIIYFTKPGDNLWKIAKRYCTSIDDIRNINALDENDQLEAGRQIIIPKRVS